VRRPRLRLVEAAACSAAAAVVGLEVGVGSAEEDGERLALASMSSNRLRRPSNCAERAACVLLSVLLRLLLPPLLLVVGIRACLGWRVGVGVEEVRRRWRLSCWRARRRDSTHAHALPLARFDAVGRLQLLAMLAGVYLAKHWLHKRVFRVWEALGRFRFCRVGAARPPPTRCDAFALRLYTLHLDRLAHK